jgi:phospholipase C
MDAAKIKTIVVAMMENRSFDNLLGYLSLPPNARADVEGLGRIPDWKERYSNVYQGHPYPPFLLTNPYDPIEADPPHERCPIATQMGQAVNGIFPMNGFVANYANAKHATPPVPGSNPPVMGYFSAEQAPVTNFFARNFAICDHWFSALPAGTQPNRLMAMSGYTRIDINRTGPIPDHYLLYDWLNDHGISWRVYHEELPFFSLLPRLIPQILEGKNFRPFREFFSDVENTPPGKFPQVIFLEPAFTDAPHLGLSSDDHAPSAIKGGQEFLLEAYRAMTSEPTLWTGMVGIVTYDEHGGFFDHVSPPLIPTEPTPDAEYAKGPFNSLGVRVPAFVISPFVQPGTTFSHTLDHTSILKLIGQVFGNGRYLPVVDQRPVGSVLDLLADNGGRAAPTIDSLDEYRAKQAGKAGFVAGSVPETPLQHAFQDALDCIRAQPVRPQGKIGELLDAFPPRPAPQP